MIPAEIADRFGLKPGAQILLKEDSHEIRILRPVTSLARVYIEPTNTCNLDCRTCMRNVWDEPAGYMAFSTFERILEGIQSFSPLPTVFFGGFGEPLSHPEIIEMVRRAKRLGVPVELITNGIMLTDDVSRRLIEIGLDALWVSIDGATPECYTDVRLGNALPQVIQNLYHLRFIQFQLYRRMTMQLGIAFVAMRRNIADLPRVVALGRQLGATRFSISNVLAHTPDLQREILYERALHDGGAQTQNAAPTVEIPRIDINNETQGPLAELLRERLHSVKLNSSDAFRLRDTCPFIEKGSLSIRWDGGISPCLPLLHDHTSYLDERERRIKAHIVGNIAAASLESLWYDPHYAAFRQRVQDFEFSPCVYCNSCEMPDQNLEDCFGNEFPTCGACLWAQGLIRCP